MGWWRTVYQKCQLDIVFVSLPCVCSKQAVNCVETARPVIVALAVGRQ